MYIIRRANLEDARGIHEAHMRSIREVCSKDHTAAEVSGWGNRSFNESDRQVAIQNHFVWVVEIEGKIQGYGQIGILKKTETSSTAYIYGLYLTLEATGHGIGKKLVELMIKAAQECGVVEINLHSTITAHTFYERFGFQDSAPERTIEIGGNEVRCFPMVKKLS